MNWLRTAGYQREADLGCRVLQIKMDLQWTTISGEVVCISLATWPLVPLLSTENLGDLPAVQRVRV